MERSAYTLLPTIQQYVVIAQMNPPSCRFPVPGWEQERLTAADATLDLPALQIVLPLRAIYRYTDLA